MNDLKIVEAICESLYPVINVIACLLVIYQHFRYKKQIKELIEFKKKMEASQGLTVEVK